MTTKNNRAFAWARILALLVICFFVTGSMAENTGTTQSNTTTTKPKPKTKSGSGGTGKGTKGKIELPWWFPSL